MENKKSPIEGMDSYKKLRQCQMNFLNSKKIGIDSEENILFFICPLNHLEIRIEVDNNDWDYIDSKEYLNILSSSIIKGCQKTETCYK